MSWHAVPSQHDEEQYTNHEEHYMHGMHHQEETGQAFFGATSSRESQQLMLRRAEHSESTEHIMPPQQRPAVYGRVKKDGEYNLSEYFHLPLSDVAKKFGICVTAFKKLCRKQGVMQWPHRTLRSIEKKMAALRAEQKFTKDDVAIEEQIAKLQARRESILSGRTSGLGDEEGAGVMLPSVSDDSSNSTTQSQASSPRTSLDISRVSFDKSLSLGEGTSSPALSTSSTRVSSQGTLTRIRSLNDVQKAAEKQAAAGQSSMAWGQNRSSSSSSSNRGFTGRRAVSHESLFSLQNHQEAAHSFQSTSRPPVYSPNSKPFRQSGGYGGGSGAGGQPLGSVSPPMQGSGGGSAIGSPSSWHPISIGSSAVMRGGDSTGFQGLESHVEKGTGKGGQQTSRGMGSLSSSSAIDHSLKQLLNENSSLRTTIDTLVKEKVAWERRHREAQIHIEKYRAFAHDLEKELRGRKLLQEQQEALHEEEGKHVKQHQQQHHHHHHQQQQHHHHGMYGGGSVLLDHEEFLPSPFV